MDSIYAMKKLLLFIFIVVFIFTGCGKTQTPVSEAAGSAGSGEVPENSLTGESTVKQTTEKTETEENKPEENSVSDAHHIKITLPDSGIDVFTPDTPNMQSYRYGPSILLDDNGRMHMYFACPGNGKGELDWISYRYSDDYGATWSDEKLVLRPTPQSLDALSVCDPDVFYYDGYYYLGYTSTIEETADGICNSVFIARSENPDGPFEKWMGNGWGGKPYPMIYYNGTCMGWGCGEPSFVVIDDIVYVYTTRDSYTPDYTRIKCTEVRTGNLKDENWVKNLEYQSTAVIRTENGPDSEYEYKDCDSWDVSYIEESGKFAAICTNRRFENDSCLLYYESDDGFSFERVSEINTNVICGCHNCGISGDKHGHIRKGDPVFAGYGYSGSRSSSWGVWACRLAPALIEYTDEIDRSEEGKENLKEPIRYGTGKGQGFEKPMMVGTVLPYWGNLNSITNLLPFFTNLEIHMTQQMAVAIRPVARFSGGFIRELDLEEIAQLGITFAVEDESVCYVREDCIIIPNSPGKTVIRAQTLEGMGINVHVTVSGEK